MSRSDPFYVQDLYAENEQLEYQCDRLKEILKKIAKETVVEESVLVDKNGSVGPTRRKKISSPAAKLAIKILKEFE